jgi:signal transduction histidine kinase
MISQAVEPDVRLAATLPPMRGNSGKLQQIFTNIVINGVQAIGYGGHLTVESAAQDGWIIVRLSDTGKGIPPENLEKIFEPFFTTKDIGQGTGLGLSVTYGLVKDMGGNIAVESKIGMGTTFTVSFPAVPVHAHGDHAMHKPSPVDSETLRHE